MVQWIIVLEGLLFGCFMYMKISHEADLIYKLSFAAAVQCWTDFDSGETGC